MKGSPGGILLIGVGIVLLNLGYTGRFAEVWKALNGGSSDSASASDPTKNAAASAASNAAAAVTANANTGADGQGAASTPAAITPGGATIPPDQPAPGRGSANDIAVANSATCNMSTATIRYGGVALNGHPMCADTSTFTQPRADGTCAGPKVIIASGAIVCVPTTALKQPGA